jgi:hypothetical protein
VEWEQRRILSSEIYAKADQSKFVAVIAERDENGNPYQPAYYRSRVHIDLSDADAHGKGFEQLLRWIYDKPLYVKPELGSAPAFLEGSPAPSLRTSALYQRAINAVRNSKDYADGAVTEYFDTFTENLEAFRISPDGQPGYDDEIVNSIEQFLPFRNEAVELVLALARYRNRPGLGATLHRFIQQSLTYQYRPADNAGWQEFHTSNYDFVVHELFLHIVASLLKYECLDATAYLFDNRYYVPNRDRNDPMVAYQEIRQYIEAFEHRKKRLESNRLSIRADMLIERCQGIGVSQAQLMQADFVVFIRAAIEARDDRYRQWWPETLLYTFRQRGPFEIFARAETQQAFRRLQPLLGLEGHSIEEAKERIASYFKLVQEGTLRLPRWEVNSFDPAELMNFNKLGTR